MFCSKCGNQYEGNPRFCANCGLNLGQRQSEGPIEPRFMDWFRNHLNWTLVIALLPITAATLIAQSLADYYIVDEYALSAVTWLLFGSSVILTAIVGGWVLNHKGRNPWWLLPAAFWGIGWIIWLALGNKRQATLAREARQTQSALRCANCKAENSSQARFCQGCGVKLEEQRQQSTAVMAVGGQPRFCTLCGHQNSSQARHCENCGRALGATQGGLP